MATTVIPIIIEKSLRIPSYNALPPHFIVVKKKSRTIRLQSIMIAAIRHISVLFIPEICECCNFVIPLQRPIDENA
jgi:hypothetical protein